jgi:hypothetical protein
VKTYAIGVPRDPIRVISMEWEPEYVNQPLETDTTAYFTLQAEAGEQPHVSIMHPGFGSVQQISVTQIGMPGDRIMIYRYAVILNGFGETTIQCDIDGVAVAILPLQVKLHYRN